MTVVATAYQSAQTFVQAQAAPPPAVAAFENRTGSVRTAEAAVKAADSGNKGNGGREVKRDDRGAERTTRRNDQGRGRNIDIAV
jgi:hypothetical protein